MKVNAANMSHVLEQQCTDKNYPVGGGGGSCNKVRP